MIMFAVNLMTQRARYVECSVMQDVRVKEGEREGASEQDDRFLPRRVFITQEVVRKFCPTPIAESVVEQWLVTRLTNL